MKLPLRYFLILCLLLGAVAIPVGWRTHQKWKANEIERLEQELDSLYAVFRTLIDDLARDPVAISKVASDPKAKASHDQKVGELRQRIVEVEDALKLLTGKRPSRPEPEGELLWPATLNPACRP